MFYTYRYTYGETKTQSPYDSELSEIDIELTRTGKTPHNCGLTDTATPPAHRGHRRDKDML